MIENPSPNVRMPTRQRSKAKRLRRLWTLGLTLAASALVGRADNSTESPNPQGQLRELQAAVLYHLLQYVEGLPVESSPDSAPLEIGVLGVDPFGEVLDRMTKLKSAGHPIVVIRGLHFEDIERCDVIFISDSETANAQAVLDSFATRPKLLVSDIEGFAHLGGMVGLGIVEGRLAIRINRGAARRVGLDFDAELLRLADEVLR